MSDDMIERVARVIDPAVFVDPSIQSGVDAAMVKARAVLQVMKEPTEAMLVPVATEPCARSIWYWMVVAALGEFFPDPKPKRARKS